MIRTPPIAIVTANLVDHPAARAWNAVGGATLATIAFLRKPTPSKPALYRLSLADPAQPAVFAKRSDAADLAVERHVYEAILPRLPVTSPRFHGACEDPDGDAWLFVEDAGNQFLSPGDPRHRVAAARWLGLLHRSAAGQVAPGTLPSAGPERYLASLRSARERIGRNMGNRALSAEDRAVLRAIVQQGETLEAHWPRLERACAGLPVTLVHADFQPKNLLVRVTEDGPSLLPIDWEKAGWGIPAADLALAKGRGLTTLIDPHTYEETVRECWPDLDGTAVRRLSVLGHVFQALAGIAWASGDLRFEWTAALIRPVSSMRIYWAKIAAAIEAGAEWLE